MDAFLHSDETSVTDLDTFRTKMLESQVLMPVVIIFADLVNGRSSDAVSRRGSIDVRTVHTVYAELRAFQKVCLRFW